MTARQSLSRRELLVLGAGAAAAFVARPFRMAEAARTVYGPMIGHVTPTTARVWAYAGGRGALSVRWWRDGETPETGHVVDVPANPDRHWVAKTTLEGLEPGTGYRYGLLLEGRAHPRWEGTFRTAPPAGEPAKFRMAFCSCMKDDYPGQEVWDRYLGHEPAFHLMIGDNVYADSTNAETLWSKHLSMRGVPQFARVLRHVPSYAIWDDHDFATDDSDGTVPGKEDSLRAFREVWANPGAGLPDVPGAFYRFSRGDVDFFVLDGRYHRTPDRAPNDARKRMLGDAQFRWLSEGLEASKAKFKVLVSASVLKDNTKDGWLAFDFERKRLFRLVAENRIPGVIYLSGDLHYCKVAVHPAAETGFYDLCEVISSGIANSPDHGFVTLDFDTTVPDPTLHIQVWHGNTGLLNVEQTIPLSRLQMPGSR